MTEILGLFPGLGLVLYPASRLTSACTEYTFVNAPRDGPPRG